MLRKATGADTEQPHNKPYFPPPLLNLAEKHQLKHSQESPCKGAYGLQNDEHLFTKISILFVSFGEVDSSSIIFEHIENPSSYLWSIVIRGYANQGRFGSSMGLYSKVMQKGLKPHKFAIPFALKSCSGFSDLNLGKSVHQHLVCCGCSNDVFVNAALVDMYSKCGDIKTARLVFDKMAVKDLVSWTSMISGSAHSGYNSETF